MNSRSEVFFSNRELDIHGSTIFLDIDGTLCAHGASVIEPEAERKIAQLVSQGNEIYLTSNHEDQSRAEHIATTLGIHYIKTRYKKPDLRVLKHLPRTALARPLVVIGDKVLTDGLFALFMGADFYPVAHIRSESDPSSVRLHYFIDTVARRIVRQ